MNPQDKQDLLKFKQLKKQRLEASKKYNLANIDEIKVKRMLQKAKKQAMETKDPEPSLVKLKPIKPKEPIKPNPIKPIKPAEVIDYKTILFKKLNKIKPIKTQKKMQLDDLIFI